MAAHMTIDSRKNKSSGYKSSKEIAEIAILCPHCGEELPNRVRFEEHLVNVHKLPKLRPRSKLTRSKSKGVPMPTTQPVANIQTSGKKKQQSKGANNKGKNKNKGSNNNNNNNKNQQNQNKNKKKSKR